MDVDEIEDGGIAEPDPGLHDRVQAAAEAVAVAEQPERELHSFEIDPAQVWARKQYAVSGKNCQVSSVPRHCDPNDSGVEHLKPAVLPHTAWLWVKRLFRCYRVDTEVLGLHIKLYPCSLSARVEHKKPRILLGSLKHPM